MNDRRRATAVATLGLLAVAAALLPGAVFKGEAFYDRDIHVEWYSQVEGFVRAVAEGALPTWDRTIGFGQSLVADPSAQVFYPPTWLNLIIPPWRYYTLFAVGHLVFGGMGVFLLLRRLRMAPWAALVGGAVWTASGPIVSLVNLWHHFASASWMPWVLLGARGALRSSRPRRTILWGLAQAGQILAGSADMVAMTALLTAALVATELRWRRPRHPRNRAVLLRAGAASLLAVALAAPLWLPAVEAVRRSSRAALPEEMRTTWSLHPLVLPQLLLPLALEEVPLAPSLDAAFFETGRMPFLQSLYLGAGALALAAAGALSARRGPRSLLVAVLVGAVLVALGRHAPFYAALASFPPMRIFRYPSKAMVVASLAFALLAGLGAEAFGRARGERRWRAVAVLAAAMALVAGTGLAITALAPQVVAGFVLAEGAAPGELRRVAWTLVLPTVAVGLAAYAARRSAGGQTPRLAAVVAFLAVLDLVVAGRPLNRTAPVPLVAFRPPVIDAVRDEEPGRLYTFDYLFSPRRSHYLGREDAYRFIPLPGVSFERMQLLSLRLYPFPPSPARWGVEGSFDRDTRGLYPWPVEYLTSLLPVVEETPAHERLLRIGAVRHVVALHTKGLEALEEVQTLPSLFLDPIRVFRLSDPLARAYAVGGSRVADGHIALGLLAGPDFDPAREVVLEAGAPREPPADFRGTCRIVSLQADRVVLEADLSHPGWVVLVDAWDPGWSVRVDSKPAALLRANVAFRGVEVPPGRHEVEFLYRPASAGLGLLVAATAAVVTIFLGRRVAGGPARA